MFTIMINLQIFVIVLFCINLCIGYIHINDDSVCLKKDIINEIFIHNSFVQEQCNSSMISNEIFSSSTPIEDQINEKSKTFIDYYHDGVKSYLSNDWESCINHIERSLILYHEYYDSITECRIRCENEKQRYIPKHSENYEDRHFYEKLIHKTLCIEKCKISTLPNLPKYFMFLDDEKEIFIRRKPYEYLQICYYRDGEIEKAISAAYTFLVANPNDEVMKKNLKFYSKSENFDFDKLNDFEDKRFSKFYQDAFEKYDKEEWDHAIELFEVALDVWQQDLEKCRAFCEGEFNQGWLPDFTTVVSNHYAYTLRGKQKCMIELSYVNGRYYEDLLLIIYNHLQYSYSKSNNTKEASQCAMSYLLFDPNSETMLENLEYYKTLPDIKDEYLVPRNEARKIFYRNLYEKELLEQIDEEFTKLYKETLINQQNKTSTVN